MNSDEGSKIVYLSQEKISIYSSEAIKRGFNLVQEIYSNIVENSNQLQSYRWTHICNITHPRNKITSVTISSDNKYIIAIDAWGTINVWDFENGHLLHQPFLGHKREVPIAGNFFYDLMQGFYESFIENGGHFNIAITQDNGKIVSIGNQEIKIWNLEKRNLVHLISNTHESYLNLHNHNIIAYENQNEEIIIFNTKDEVIISKIETGFTDIEHFAISKNTQCLVVSGHNLIGGDWEEEEYINEHSIKIWNFSKPEPIQVNNFVDTENIKESPRIFVSYDGKILVSLSEDVNDESSNLSGFNFHDTTYTVKTWDTDDGNLLHEMKLDSNIINITSTRQLIHYSEQSDEIQIRDLWTGKLITKINMGKFTNTFASTSDGKFIASISHENKTNKIHIWDSEADQLIYKSEDLGTSVQDLIFNQDDKTLISINYDGSADIWKLNKGVGEIESRNNLSFLNFR